MCLCVLCVCVCVCVGGGGLGGGGCNCVCLCLCVYVHFCVFLRVFQPFEVFFFIFFELLAATLQAPIATTGKLLTRLTMCRVEGSHFKTSCPNT